MEALLVTRLVFAAYDTPSLQAKLLQNPDHVASELNLPAIVVMAAATAIQQDIELKSAIWM